MASRFTQFACGCLFLRLFSSPGTEKAAFVGLSSAVVGRGLVHLQIDHLVLVLDLMTNLLLNGNNWLQNPKFLPYQLGIHLVIVALKSALQIPYLLPIRENTRPIARLSQTRILPLRRHLAQPILFSLRYISRCRLLPVSEQWMMVL